MSSLDTSERRFKRISFRDASIRDNIITGRAAGIGNMDRIGDVIFPGAFSRVSETFLREGFVSDSHDWRMMSVHAMPLVCEERGRWLYTEAEFHSTADSQAIRQKCMERIERGLMVGLSIGFFVNRSSVIRFSNGKNLLNHAEENGYDISLFDVDAISNHDRECSGIVAIDELYEYSIVPVPMNPLAMATDVKFLSSPASFSDYSSSVSSDLRRTMLSSFPDVHDILWGDVSCIDSTWSSISVLHDVALRMLRDIIFNGIIDREVIYGVMKEYCISCSDFLFKVFDGLSSEERGRVLSLYDEEFIDPFLPDYDVMQLSKHLRLLGSAARSLASRAERVRSYRIASGRDISCDARESLVSVRSSLESARCAMDSILSSASCSQGERIYSELVRAALDRYESLCTHGGE